MKCNYVILALLVGCALRRNELAELDVETTQQREAIGVASRNFPGQIRQVLSTLLLDAIEAMPAGGTLAVGVRKSFHWRNPASEGIRVVMVDSGVGIPPNNAGRIFEPFFTTKGEQGTGLGLWVANGIISRLGGSIQMRSSVRPGKIGTCFSIFLPARSPEAVDL
jgi:two-component system CheB/CheR fusion protein